VQTGNDTLGSEGGSHKKLKINISWAKTSWAPLSTCFRGAA